MVIPYFEPFSYKYVQSIINKDKNKYQGSNHHDKYTKTEIAKRLAKIKKKRNKKRKLLKRFK